MKTNRSFRSIAVIVLIAIVSMLLTACQGNAVHETMNFVANAAYSEDSSANWSLLQSSPRIADCDMSSHQLLLNAINGETNPETGVVDNITIGQWLDSKMGQFTCITEEK